MSDAATTGKASDDVTVISDLSIRPFEVNVPQDVLDDLRRRVAAMRWPSRELVDDRTQGVQLATMEALARHWATDYDWRAVEARLQALPQFLTEIDGVDIHFIHVRSQHEGAMPVIVTHGWPGSIIEQLKIIGPLTDPTAHGASADDAFDVVIPSLPGHGFSGTPTETGWDPIRIARAWATLMERLGYTKYVAQGGDWGNAVTEQMALLTPQGLLASTRTWRRRSPTTSRAHSTLATAARGPRRGRAVRVGSARGLLRARPRVRPGDGGPPADAVRARGFTRRVGRMDARSRRAQPVADRACLRRRIRRADEGRHPRQRHAVLADEDGRLIGTLVLGEQASVLRAQGRHAADRRQRLPRRDLRRPATLGRAGLSEPIHYHRLPKGGHFAAWEQPELFSEELRATFRSLR